MNVSCFLPLTRLQREALLECARFPRGSYTWKPQAMQLLADRGLAQIVGSKDKKPAYALTDAGTAMAEQVRAERITHRAVKPAKRRRS